MATIASIAAIRPTTGDELLAAKTHATIATCTGC
jgi:hypothetical protein